MSNESTDVDRGAGEQLRQIWTDVLQVPVGTEDMFLDLGGDSLSAMMCIARIRNAFGVGFEVEDFFMNDATVASFASEINRRRQREVSCTR